MTTDEVTRAVHLLLSAQLGEVTQELVCAGQVVARRLIEMQQSADYFRSVSYECEHECEKPQFELRCCKCGGKAIAEENP